MGVTAVIFVWNSQIIIAKNNMVHGEIWKYGPIKWTKQFLKINPSEAKLK
jgi:hypothetical protein